MACSSDWSPHQGDDRVQPLSQLHSTRVLVPRLPKPHVARPGQERPAQNKCTEQRQTGDGTNQNRTLRLYLPLQAQVPGTDPKLRPVLARSAVVTSK